MQRCRFLIRILIIIVVSIIVFHKVFVLPGFPNFNHFGILNVHESHVPNVVHYVIFKNSSLDFITFLSMTSTIKIQKPDSIVIHSNLPEVVCSGKYWKLIDALSNHFHVTIRKKYYEVPTHVYGQRLSSVYHSSDVARLDILLFEGGIYLDTDSLILKPLHRFLQYETTLACPDKDYVGNQVIIAAKDSRFINLWLKSYRRYQPTQWYMNAGQYSTSLLEERPELVNKLTTEFGVQNLLNELYVQPNWDEWKWMYTIHLLIRHDPAPQFVNETEKYPNAFGKILRWLLYEVEPKLQPSMTWQ